MSNVRVDLPRAGSWKELRRRKIDLIFSDSDHLGSAVENRATSHRLYLYGGPTASRSRANRRRISEPVADSSSTELPVWLVWHYHGGTGAPRVCRYADAAVISCARRRNRRSIDHQAVSSLARRPRSI